jgi:hypothetical protein
MRQHGTYVRRRPTSPAHHPARAGPLQTHGSGSAALPSCAALRCRRVRQPPRRRRRCRAAGAHALPPRCLPAPRRLARRPVLHRRRRCRSRRLQASAGGPRAPLRWAGRGSRLGLHSSDAWQSAPLLCLGNGTLTGVYCTDVAVWHERQGQGEPAVKDVARPPSLISRVCQQQWAARSRTSRPARVNRMEAPRKQPQPRVHALAVSGHVVEAWQMVQDCFAHKAASGLLRTGTHARHRAVKPNSERAPPGHRSCKRRGRELASSLMGGIDQCAKRGQSGGRLGASRRVSAKRAGCYVALVRCGLEACTVAQCVQLLWLAAHRSRLVRSSITMAA